MEHLLLLQVQSLIPNDFELPIPGNVSFFQFLIVFSFACHIIFVNITIAGAVFSVINEIKGIRLQNKVYDKLALQLATQTSIYKSIAVVLGVAPMLLISVIYSQFFYPSTILIGKAWLSLIIIIIVAFLLLYVYKFSWNRYQEKKGLHLVYGVSGTLLLLFVPLIFIVNVVSMLYPEMWAGSKGFFHGLFYYPQVWQRYAHFVLSSFAVMGIFMYMYNNRQFKKMQQNNGCNNSAHAEVAVAEENSNIEADVYKEGKRFGVKTAFWTTILQILVGSLVLISLEKDKMMLYMGENMLLTSFLIVSIIGTVALIFFLYMVMKTDAKRWLNLAATAFIVVIAIMGWMRYEVRESYVQPHQQLNPPTVQAETLTIQAFVEK
ncbi:MAG TPA: cytochrome c class I [Bacillus bacterium]|nr:cytochrome c class I [Bacillus sp. (in: firmicutes)]